MMTPKEKTFAYPQTTRRISELWTEGGLTKREMFAVAAMQGLLASLNPAVDVSAQAITDNATLLADSLLRSLGAETD